MFRLNLKSIFNRTALAGIGLLVMLPASESNAAPAAFQAKGKSFNKITTRSVPNKKIGVGHPSPYSNLNRSTFGSYPSSGKTTTFSRPGSKGHGHPHNNGRHSSQRPTFYSYKTNSRNLYSSGIGRSTFLSVSPGRSFGLSYGASYGAIPYGVRYGVPYGTSTYYRPTYSSGVQFIPAYGSVYGGNYSNYGYSNPSFGPVNPQPIPATIGLTPSEAISAGDLMNDRSNPSVIRNEFYPQIPTAASARPTQQLAEQAFKRGNYGESAQLAKQAMRLDPDNGRLKLFASHANFATGDFATSARLLNEATSRLRSDQWGFVVRNFKNFYGLNDYVPQTQRLSRHITDNPGDANALALRGYHYGALGYLDSATSDFRRAINLAPNNTLAQRLLPVLGSSVAPISPEMIDTPIPSQLDPNQPQTGRGPDGIIRLVPQFSDAQLDGTIVTQELSLEGPVIVDPGQIQPGQIQPGQIQPVPDAGGESVLINNDK